MCLAIPAKVISIDGLRAEVDMLGNTTSADLTMLPGVAVGDFIMVHAGFAIEKYDEVEAAETLSLFKEMAAKNAAA